MGIDVAPRVQVTAQAAGFGVVLVAGGVLADRALTAESLRGRAATMGDATMALAHRHAEHANALAKLAAARDAPVPAGDDDALRAWARAISAEAMGTVVGADGTSFTSRVLAMGEPTTNAYDAIEQLRELSDGGRAATAVLRAHDAGHVPVSISFGAIGDPTAVVNATFVPSSTYVSYVAAPGRVAVSLPPSAEMEAVTTATNALEAARTKVSDAATAARQLAEHASGHGRNVRYVAMAGAGLALLAAATYALDGSGG